MNTREQPSQKKPLKYYRNKILSIFGMMFILILTIGGIANAGIFSTGQQIIQNNEFLSGNCKLSLTDGLICGTNTTVVNETGFYGKITPTGDVNMGGNNITNVTASYYGITWNSSTNTYTRTGTLAGQPVSQTLDDSLLPIQASMKRVVINDRGQIQYYLNPSNSSQKLDGSLAVLNGSDGQVMTQIALFYYRFSVSGTSTYEWDISRSPLDGFSVYPAFLVNGKIAPYIYVGSYEGSMWDASTGAMVPAANITDNMYAAGDKLSSVSGTYPKTNEMRSEFRAMAANRGVGWGLESYDIASAIQLLYLTEYADFDSQSMIGQGRTQLSGCSWAADSCIGQTGKSNVYGDGTGNVEGNTNDAVMSYRGVENIYGDVWNFIDGINIYNNTVYVSNNYADFADDTTTGYTALGVTLPSTSGYQQTLQTIRRGFLPASVGTDTTKIGDYYSQSTGWRVVLLGGAAADGAQAGAFRLAASGAASVDDVIIGGRLVYIPVTQDVQTNNFKVVNNTGTTVMSVTSTGTILPYGNNTADIGATGNGYNRVWASSFAGGEFVDKAPGGYDYTDLWSWDNHSVPINSSNLSEGYNNWSTPNISSDLYYKAVELNTTTGKWDLSHTWGTISSVGIIPDDNDFIVDKRLVILGGYRAWVYGNISIGDKLYTSGAPGKEGILTNARNKPVMSYQYTDTGWKFVDLPATTDPALYNLYNSAQGVGASVIAVALESYNSNTPGIIKVKVFNT